MDPLTDGGGHRELNFGQEEVWDDSVEVHKHDPHISPWSV